MAPPYEEPPIDPMKRARVREVAYHTVNRLLTSAGLALALAGISPRSAEVEAIRRALRAVNIAGGIEPVVSAKEAIRAFPPRGGRFPRSAG